jgi:hypothetical protein
VPRLHVPTPESSPTMSRVGTDMIDRPSRSESLSEVQLLDDSVRSTIPSMTLGLWRSSRARRLGLLKLSRPPEWRRIHDLEAGHMLKLLYRGSIPCGFERREIGAGLVKVVGKRTGFFQRKLFQPVPTVGQLTAGQRGVRATGIEQRQQAARFVRKCFRPARAYPSVFQPDFKRPVAWIASISF